MTKDREPALRIEPPESSNPLGVGCRIAEDVYTRLEKIGQGTFG